MRLFMKLKLMVLTMFMLNVGNAHAGQTTLNDITSSKNTWVSGCLTGSLKISFNFNNQSRGNILIKSFAFDSDCSGEIYSELSSPFRMQHYPKTKVMDSHIKLTLTNIDVDKKEAKSDNELFGICYDDENPCLYKRLAKKTLIQAMDQITFLSSEKIQINLPMLGLVDFTKSKGGK